MLAFKTLIIAFLFLSINLFSSECVFCDENVLSRQIYYENDHALGLTSNRPIHKGHCLIIPKRHVARFEELTDEEWLDMKKIINKTHEACKKLFKVNYYILLQKNGKSVGQTVFHVHFHYIPQHYDSGFLYYFSFLTNLFKHPIKNEDMKFITDEIKKGID
jgi:histidine triad (HIT) family protein